MRNKCSIKNCIDYCIGFGYCNVHYRRFKKWGNPLIIKIKTNCIIKNCFDKHWAKGYCSRHYKSFKNHNDPLWVKINKVCKICNSNNYEANGLCKSCYKKKWDKDNPQNTLLSNKRQLEKISKIFNITSNQYMYAIISWSKVVKKRDKCCKICGSTKNLNAHHILYKANYPQLSLNINNGITLCKPCHEELHGFKVYH